jgi:alkanesulfonate monooxygenase SsuD/methylene tetrahydromethanopterin reductase-like flavin-dependent oxidoreductase (luciferase family)
MEIPIICAAGGPKMAGNAGRVADGYVSVGIPPSVHRDVMQPAFAEGWRESERLAQESRFKSAWVSTSYHPNAERALDGARVYGGLLIPEAYAYIEDPRVIEQRALLVRDDAMQAAFCIASSGEQIIAQFERFIDAGCNHIIWADMSPDPFLVADVCRNEVLPFLKSKYGSDVEATTSVAR